MKSIKFVVISIIYIICYSAFSPVSAQNDVLNSLKSIAIIEQKVMVPMRDGVRLATDIYRPKDATGKVPLIFIKTPYDFNEIGGASLQWAYKAVSHGYAVAIQNERGRYYSEGEWEILGNFDK